MEGAQRHPTFEKRRRTRLHLLMRDTRTLRRYSWRGSGLTDLDTLIIRIAKEKMQQQEGHFQGIDKTPLYFQSWTAVNPKGLVMVVHG